jgi:hypothetical protein
MPAQFTLPPDTRSVGSGNPPADMNAVVDALAAMGAGVNVLNAAFAGGADPTGAAACDTVLSDALAAGGLVVIPPGTYLVNGSSALSLAVAGTALRGAGPGSTVIKIGGSFSGSQVFGVTADSCTISGLSVIGASSAVSSNPAAGAIQVTGAQRCRLQDLFFQFVNGYAIDMDGSAGSGCLDSMIRNIVGRQCAGGIHLLGVTGSSFQAENFLTDIQLQRIGAGTSALDALLAEDCQDVLIANYNGSVLGGSATGKTFHLKGACTSVFVTNADIGMITRGTASPVLHVESGTNGSPAGCGFTGGVVQAGNVGIQVDAGTDIGFHSLKIKNNSTDNVQVTGGDQIAFDAGCNFTTGNQSGTTASDVHLTSSSGFVYVRGCIFASPVSTTPAAGNVTSPVNDVNHRGIFENCAFTGTGSTPSTVFSGTAQIVRHCTGYNPRGSVTAGTIGASPATVNTSQHDVLIIFTAINSLTAFKIGGTAVGVLPVNGQAYFVPARTSLEVDYSGTAPTWQWFAC